MARVTFPPEDRFQWTLSLLLLLVRLFALALSSTLARQKINLHATDELSRDVAHRTGVMYLAAFACSIHVLVQSLCGMSETGCVRA